MKASVIPCGPAVNESERRAVERLKSGLIGHPGNAEWLLLTNLTFSATHRLQSDEVDIVAFFTVTDPAAPGVIERVEDDEWDSTARVSFARSAVRAVQELHAASNGDEPLLHRNLTPRSILVRHDNSPILTGFEHARIPAEVTVASPPDAHDRDDTVAPEVRAHGRGAADRRSDVYALCASLSVLFDGRDDQLARAAKQAMAGGTAPDRAARASPADLDRSLSKLLGESPPTPPAPPARFWTEDQVVRFDGQDYRIVAKLGSGGVGATFKVVEIDRDTKEDLGAYVAKVVRDRAAGQRVLRGHRLVRSHLRRAAFSTGTRAYSCSVRAGCPTPTSAPRRLRRQPPSRSLTSRRRRVDRMPRRPTPRQPNPRILRRLLPKLPRPPRPSAP